MKPFDEIAGEWDENRSTPSPVLSLFLSLVKPTDSVLDAGCGNGRNLVELAKRASHAWGVDESKEMLESARKRIDAAGLSQKCTLIEEDLASLSLEDGSVDATACLASFHHLKTPEWRLAALNEFSRVLAPNGRLFLSVWNRHQERFKGLAGSDAHIPWKKKDGSTVKRFYHFFEERELRSLLGTTGFEGATFFEKNGKQVREKEGAHNLCAIAIRH